MKNEQVHTTLLPHLFRQEYTKMTAILCRHFGLKHIETAEDIASDVFLKASELWAISGVPENPVAWLYTVARNKAKDYCKRNQIFETKVKEAVKPEETVTEPDFEFSRQNIADSQLAMMFAVCNPVNTTEGQICLALQILCGFSVKEIANAFLAKPETIKKRLQRARTYLQNDHFEIRPLTETEIETRLETVLQTLYLLFNEGYFSKTHDQLIRRELCSEAVRLTLLLTEQPLTCKPQVNALLALMCFQSSRLNARENNGEAVLFAEQDKELWDKDLIERGNYYLMQAYTGGEVSTYHLEAGIAHCHTYREDADKWKYILPLYDRLLQLEYSPVAALNRNFALAKVHGYEVAIEETEQLQLVGNNYYHSLLGYLYTTVDLEKSILHYEMALELSDSKKEKQTLRKRLEKLRGNDQ